MVSVIFVSLWFNGSESSAIVLIKTLCRTDAGQGESTFHARPRNGDRGRPARPEHTEKTR